MKFIEKIKEFFSKLFSSKKLLDEGSVVNTSSETIKENMNTEVSNSNSNALSGSAQYRELVELQKLYLRGEIKETDMTSEQVLALESLFDSQIENARRKNEATKKKIFKILSEDQKTMEVYSKVKSGELEKDQLTDDQVLQIEFLYDIENSKMTAKQTA